MGFVILVRNPRNNKIVAVEEDEGEIAVFVSEEAARATANIVPICQAWPYEIVEAP